MSGVKAVAANVGGNTVAGAFIGLEATLANAVLDEIDGDGGSIEGIGKNVRDGAIFGAAGSIAGEAIVGAATKSGVKVFGSSGTLNGAGRAAAEGATNVISNSADVKNTMIEKKPNRF